MGTSTRKDDALVKTLRCRSGVSRSTVSRICANIDRQVEAFRGHRLDHQPFVYVWVDATYVHVRQNSHVTTVAVVLATGVRGDGHREILGVDLGNSECETFWSEFLAELKGRGLHGVRLVISDCHAGLKAAIARQFQGATWQRCRVHAMRNLLAVAQPNLRPVISALIRTIFAQPDAPAAKQQLRSVVDQLHQGCPKVAERLAASEADLLAYSAFPREHWPKIWSNNPIERLNRELKRRTNVVQIFPDPKSAIRLVGALLVEINDELTTTQRRYISAASHAPLTNNNQPTSLPAAPRT